MDYCRYLWLSHRFKCYFPVSSLLSIHNKLCGRPPQYAPAACKLTFDLLTFTVVFVSRVTWATSVPILVFLGLSVLDLDPIYATDRQTSDAHHRLMPRGHNKAFIDATFRLNLTGRLHGPIVGPTGRSDWSVRPVG